MALYIGQSGSLGICKETVRGTAQDPTMSIPIKELSYDTKTVIKEIGGAMGNIQQNRETVVTKKFAEGSFKADMDDKAMGYILTGLFGAVPTTTGTTNYVHTFAIANNNVHQSLGIRIQDPNINVDFPLAMIDSFDFSVEPENIVEYNVNFRSRGGADTTTDTPVYTALGNIFNHTQAVIKIASNVAGLAASSAVSVTNFKLSVKKNVEDFNDLGSITTAEIVNKMIEVEGEIELGYSDQVYRDLMLAGTYQAMSITLTKGINNSISFTMPKLPFSGWEPNKPLDDIATQTVKFKALYDATNSADLISAVLKNQTTNYTT